MPNTAGHMANSVDSNQTLYSVASDLGLVQAKHYLPHYSAINDLLHVHKYFNKNLIGCLWKQRTQKRTKIEDSVLHHENIPI